MTIVDPRQLRDALGAFTTGVTIVTTRDPQARDIGLTANSFNSVSLDPPMVLWSLAKSSLSLAAFVESEHFAVHILSAEQQALSDRFAKRGADKFAGLELARGIGNVPLLEGCSARFECRAAFRYDGGDHEIIVGEVLRFDHFGRPPLVFHSGRYGLVVKHSQPGATVEQRAQEDTIGRNFLGYLLGTAYHQLLIPIRAELRRRGLSERDYYLLSIVGMDDVRPLSEAEQLLAFAGYELNAQLVMELESHGLIEHEGAALRLTQLGRRTMIELIAVAKAAESVVESALDYSESQLLKQLLRRLIRQAGNERPPLWRNRKASP